MKERDKELAHKAFDITVDSRDRITYSCDEYGLKAFSDLIRADEREACAKVCEGVAYVFAQPHHYAAIIRERGNT